MKNEITDPKNHYLDTILKHLNFLSHVELDEEDIKDIEISSNKYTDIKVMDFLSVDGTSPEIVKDEILRLKTTTNLILNSIEKGFEKSSEKLDDIFKKIKGFEKFHENYPPYVKLNHPEEGLKFYKKLKKEEYNYSEVSNLIGGKTRQLISTEHQRGKFGVYDGKKKKISKEKLYTYFINELEKKKTT